MKKAAREFGHPRKIGILGHFGFGNLGDEAVVAILIKKLKDYYPDAELCGICLNPKDTETRYGIKAFPIRRLSETHELFEQPAAERLMFEPGLPEKLRAILKNSPSAFLLVSILRKILHYPRKVLAELSFLRRSYGRLRGFDLLVVAGSGQLNDFWGGPWRHPYTLLSWAILARMAGAGVIVLSIGAGQLRSRLGMFFCKWFLRLASYRSFRDLHSRELMEKVGLEGSNPVFPDQGFALREVIQNLPEPSAGNARSGDREGALIVGLNPVAKAYFIARGADENPYLKYIDNLTRFVAWLLREGHRVSFCPSDVLQDRAVVERILAGLDALGADPDWSSRIDRDPILTVEDLTRRIQRADLVIASRFHGVVISLLFHKPVIGISYTRKIRDLMAEMGLGEYCFKIDRFELKDLVEKFESIAANRRMISETLRARVSSYKSALEFQYSNVFTLSR